MKAEVVRLTAEGNCEARTENGLLVVFTQPRDRVLCLSDLLEFEDLAVEGDVSVEDLTRGDSFAVHIAHRDIHDLRLPSSHGSRRTPSAARLRGA